MVSATQMTKQKSATHAVARDFCRIFEEDMDGLYLLSLLLTADHAMAEKCFVDGLADSAKSPRVFKEWAHSWARRTVVQNAIRMIGPQPGNSAAGHIPGEGNIATSSEMSAIFQLSLFQRFVFVMSVLERYSDQDCALLLDCTRNDVIAARVRALQRLGSMSDTNRVQVAPRDEARELSELALRIESVPLLATLP